MKRNIITVLTGISLMAVLSACGGQNGKPAESSRENISENRTDDVDALLKDSDTEDTGGSKSDGKTSDYDIPSRYEIENTPVGRIEDSPEFERAVEDNPVLEDWGNKIISVRVK